MMASSSVVPMLVSLCPNIHSPISILQPDTEWWRQTGRMDIRDVSEVEFLEAIDAGLDIGMAFKFLSWMTAWMVAHIHQDREQNKRSAFRAGDNEFCLDLQNGAVERVRVPALAALNHGTSGESLHLSEPVPLSVKLG